MCSRRLLPILLLPVLFTACGGPDAVLFLDPYIRLSVPSVPILEECARTAAEQAGMRIRTAPVDFGADPLAGVVEAVRGTEGESVILGPLFAGEAGSLARLFPDRRFLFLASGEPGREEGDRLLFVPTDRRRAYRAAGKAAAELIAVRRAAETDTGAIPSAAAFFYTGTAGRAAELEAFLEGYRSAGGDDTLRVVEIDTLSGQETIRTAYREFQTGKQVFLVASVSGLNGFLLDLSEESGAPVITEYWEASGAYAERVLFSVEDDLCAGIRSAFARLAGTEEEGTVPGRIVEGPAMGRVREANPDFSSWEELYERE